MKVTGLVLALIVASVAEEEPTRAQAVIYSHGQKSYVGTFDFDQADSSGMLRANALNMTLVPGEYVIMAHTIPNANGECLCPVPGDKREFSMFQASRDLYEGKAISFKIFTMKIYEDLSHNVHNLSTSATLSSNRTNSILNGVITIYEASTFKDDQSNSTNSGVACGEVTMRARATLFFNDGSRVHEQYDIAERGPNVAGTIVGTASDWDGGFYVPTDLRGSFNGVPPGKYRFLLYADRTPFTDCESLVRSRNSTAHYD